VLQTAKENGMSARPEAASVAAMAPMRRIRLGVLASHPIQYQAPLFRALAARPDVDLQVFFCCKWGLEPYQDPEFGVRLSWDIPLLEGYKSTFLNNLSIRPGPNRLLGLINPGIAVHVLKRNFDALWIHGWALATNWIALAAASATSMPVLLRGEFTGFDEPEGAKAALKRTILRAIFEGIAGFLAIGTNNENFYRSYNVPKERIFWTPYAVDNRFFMEQAQRLAGCKRALRKREGIATDRPLILFSGKLVEKKRPLDLLRAFETSCGEIRASLAFAGDGPLRTQLRQFVDERRLRNVHFLGFRNQTEIGACYAMADVLVLPSSLETWGLVVNEAMCFGLPVIASDQVAAAADLVRDGTNGFVYPVGDSVALAGRLRSVLGDEWRRTRMGRQSYNIISTWDFDQDVAGVLNALRSLVGENGGPGDIGGRRAH
jgi:glycosyltransferase involved in cell wall biosynthesis